MRSRIFTVPRYLYLNLYALLLLIGGVVALVIPIGEGVIWFIILKGTICLICFKGVYGILASWPDKKRKYNILITRNQELFRPETFKEYMEAPCGRLLVKVVLRDLGLSHEYNGLYKQYHKPYWEFLKENMKPQETKVYINPQYIPNKKGNLKKLS